MENSFSIILSSCGKDSFSSLKISFDKRIFINRDNIAPALNTNKNPALENVMYAIAIVLTDALKSNNTLLRKYKIKPVSNQITTVLLFRFSSFLPFAPINEITSSPNAINFERLKLLNNPVL